MTQLLSGDFVLKHTYIHLRDETPVCAFLLLITLPKAIQHFTFNFHWTAQVYEKKVCTITKTVTKQISYLDRYSQLNYLPHNHVYCHDDFGHSSTIMNMISDHSKWTKWSEISKWIQSGLVHVRVMFLKYIAHIKITQIEHKVPI
jgi:hypothetical protein